MSSRWDGQAERRRSPAIVATRRKRTIDRGREVPPADSCTAAKKIVSQWLPLKENEALRWRPTFGLMCSALVALRTDRFLSFLISAGLSFGRSMSSVILLILPLKTKGTW
jgi:hypothetical protein